MNRDTDLFVQAFSVKCRETIRPELDFTVDDLKSEGHAAHVATQEYSDVPDGLPEAGPSVILTVHPQRRGRWPCPALPGRRRPQRCRGDGVDRHVAPS